MRLERRGSRVSVSGASKSHIALSIRALRSAVPWTLPGFSRVLGYAEAPYSRARRLAGKLPMHPRLLNTRLRAQRFNKSNGKARPRPSKPAPAQRSGATPGGLAVPYPPAVRHVAALEEAAPAKE